ncbi:unnamed protein product [Mytilus coruscus]|uniref:Uncharacterized protein n=1 Tax=Mytilus coruscus TaxID=42192 RepID=A0A6J8A067_MYTCO|nr:unnamed protein product [Mytilus coruscus]
MLVYIIIAVFIVDKASTSGTWKLTNLTVSFGKDAYLLCLIDGKECNISKQQPDPRGWTGGPHYKMLCMNGVCQNSSKYEMKALNTSLNFGLLIHNFSESDLDCPYTCFCGFSDFTNTLSVDPKNVISLPAINKTRKGRRFINNGNIDIEIILNKVNPVPNCSALFMGQVINKTTVSVMKWYTYYNDVKVTYSFSVDDFCCEGNLQLQCTLAHHQITIIDEYIDICQELVVPFLGDKGSILTMILLPIGCFVFFVILSIYICLKRRQHEMNEWV